MRPSLFWGWTPGNPTLANSTAGVTLHGAAMALDTVVVKAEVAATPGRTLYDAALAGGAQALGQAVGELAVGKRADWLVLDGNDPYLATASGDGILNRWLFAGGDRQVRDVLVNGKWVVRGGQHAGEEDSNRAFTQVLRNLLG